MKSDRKLFLMFVRGLVELLEAGLPVRKAIECIQASQRHSRCGTLAGSILHFMLDGYSFSSALQLNTLIHVDRQSVSVLAAAEKTGDYVPALRFIISEEEHREETVAHLAEVAAYPLLVLCAAGAGTGVLLRQYKLFSFEVPPAGAIEACIKAGLFFTLFLVSFCVTYYRLFSTDAKELFFYETGYLLESGLCVTDVLHIISAFSEKKTALLADRMLPEIRAGVSFPDVFRKMHPQKDDTETQLLLDLTLSDGRLAPMCMTIWSRMKKKSDRKKQFALRMAEPVLLSGTGICLLILLEGSVLPFLTQFGGVL